MNASDVSNEALNTMMRDMSDIDIDNGIVRSAVRDVCDEHPRSVINQLNLWGVTFGEFLELINAPTQE